MLNGRPPGPSIQLPFSDYPSLVEALATNTATTTQFEQFRHMIQHDPDFRGLLIDRYNRYRLEDPARANQLHTVLATLVGRRPSFLLNLFAPEEHNHPLASQRRPVQTRNQEQERATMSAQTPFAAVSAVTAALTGGIAPLPQGASMQTDQAGRDQQGRQRRDDQGRRDWTSQHLTNPRLIELVAEGQATEAQLRTFEALIQNDALFQTLVLERIRRFFAARSREKAIRLRAVMTGIWLVKDAEAREAEGAGRAQGGGRGAIQGGNTTAHRPGGLLRSLSELIYMSDPGRPR